MAKNPGQRIRGLCVAVILAAAPAWAAEAALDGLPAAAVSSASGERWTAQRSGALLPVPAVDAPALPVNYTLVSPGADRRMNWTRGSYASSPRSGFADFGPGRRVTSDLDSLVELHWRLGERRSAIPVLEVAGCDLMSPEQMRAIRGRREGSRRKLAAVVSFLKTGCE